MCNECGWSLSSLLLLVSHRVFFICLILIRWDWASLLHGSTFVGHLTVAAFWCDWFRYLCLWLPFKCFTHCHTLVIFNVIIFELRVCKRCLFFFLLSFRCCTSYVCCLSLSFTQLRVCGWNAFFCSYLLIIRNKCINLLISVWLLS